MNAKYLERKKLLDKILKDKPSKRNLSKSQVDIFAQNVGDDLRDYFFLKLENPSWIKDLNKKGEFSFPKVIEGEGDVLINSDVWSQGIYLSKVAKTNADEVFEIIKPYLEDRLSKNINVGRFVLMRIFKISENFPDDKDYSLEVGKAYLACLKHGQNLEAVTNAHEVKSFLKDLARRGCEDLVLEIAEELLRMKPAEDAESRNFKTRFSDAYNMEDYYCGEILEVVKSAVLTKNSLELLKVLCGILKQAIDVDGLSKKSNRRLCFDRSAIEDHEQDEYRNAAEFKIISAIRDVAEYIFESDSENKSEVIKALEVRLSDGSELLIFTRIILHLLRKYPQGMRKPIAKYLASKERFDDFTIHHEYYRLIKQEFANLSLVNQNKILGLIEKGFEEKRKILDQDLYARRWLFDKIDCIKNALNGAWKKKYAELSEEFKAAEHPDLLTFVSECVIVEDKSPLTAGDLSKKSLAEIIKFLIEWKPSGGWNKPNPRGLGDALEKDFGRTPKKYLDDLLLFKTVPNPTYLNHIFSALAKYADKTEGDWSAVIELGKWVAEQSSEFTNKDSKISPFDSDHHFGFCKQEFARLIDESCKSKEQNKSPIPAKLFEDVISVLEKLILDNDIILDGLSMESADEDRYYIRAINSCHGAAISAAIEFALWLFKKNDKAAATKLLLPLLDKLISKDQYLEGFAVLGRYLPWIMMIDRKWVEKNLDKILPENNRNKFNATWLTYINFVPPFDDAFEILKNKYLFVLKRGEQNKDDKRSGFKLGGSLAAFYARGKVGLDDEILENLFEKNSKEGAAMISSIGRWCCNENNPLSENMVIRFKELWDWRIENQELRKISTEEYRSFKWWYKSGLFDRKWAVGKLLESVQNSDENKRLEIFIVGEKLLGDLQNYPETAWEVIKLTLQANGYFTQVDRNFIIEAFKLIEESAWKKIKKEAALAKDEFCKKNRLDENFNPW